MIGAGQTIFIQKIYKHLSKIETMRLIEFICLFDRILQMAVSSNHSKYQALHYTTLQRIWNPILISSIIDVDPISALHYGHATSSNRPAIRRARILCLPVSRIARYVLIARRSAGSEHFHIGADDRIGQHGIHRTWIAIWRQKITQPRWENLSWPVDLTCKATD